MFPHAVIISSLTTTQPAWAPPRRLLALCASWPWTQQPPTSLGRSSPSMAACTCDGSWQHRAACSDQPAASTYFSLEPAARGSSCQTSGDMNMWWEQSRLYGQRLILLASMRAGTDGTSRVPGGLPTSWRTGPLFRVLAHLVTMCCANRSCRCGLWCGAKPLSMVPL